jgi:hypothetical protein
MTKHIALLGAGFSRNWGGWLADEAFEYLLGLPEIQVQPDIVSRLWKHQLKGGYEATLEEFQNEAKRSAHADSKTKLGVLVQAIVTMFADMNSAFLKRSLNFGDDARRFLTNFDAIYTLNQDLLLEYQYMNGVFPSGGGTKGWEGAYLPGVKWPFANAVYEAQPWQETRWIIETKTPTAIEQRRQPYIKLHGSTMWRHQGDDSSVLIMGGHKAGSIADDPLLKWYMQQFADTLIEPDTRLMVIGYGWLDTHINRAIDEGVKHGLMVFNVSPAGADCYTDTPGSGPGMIKVKSKLEGCLVGASRRGMREIVNPSEVEHGKVMRFFG